MAEEVRLDLEVETGDSNIRVEELTENVKQLKQNVEGINFEMVTESFTNFTNTVKEGMESSVANVVLFANKSIEIQDVLAKKTLEKDEQLAQSRIAIANSIVSSLPLSQALLLQP